jgi:inosine-uridine nucleoside N-ribohydrolase
MCDIWGEILAKFLPHFGIKESAIADMNVLLHDPLALSCLIRPEFLEFETKKVGLETRDDGYLYTVEVEEDGTDVEVAVSADYDGFENFLVERILTH